MQICRFRFYLTWSRMERFGKHYPISSLAWTVDWILPEPVHNGKLNIFFEITNIFLPPHKLNCENVKHFVSIFENILTNSNDFSFHNRLDWEEKTFLLHFQGKASWTDLKYLIVWAFVMKKHFLISWSFAGGKLNLSSDLMQGVCIEEIILFSC